MNDLATQLVILKGQRADALAAGRDTVKLDKEITSLTLDQESRAILNQREIAAQAEADRQGFLGDTRQTVQKWKDVTDRIGALNAKREEHQAAATALGTQIADIQGNELQRLEGRLHHAMREAKDHGCTAAQVMGMWEEVQIATDTTKKSVVINERD